MCVCMCVCVFTLIIGGVYRGGRFYGCRDLLLSGVFWLVYKDGFDVFFRAFFF